MANFPMRFAIVPFTSTFVPLLLGHGTGSLENIAACWVQHFLVLAISWQVLAPQIEHGAVDFRAAPYAQYAFRVEELKSRLSAVGPYVWCADGVLVAAQRLRPGLGPEARRRQAGGQAGVTRFNRPLFLRDAQ